MSKILKFPEPKKKLAGDELSIDTAKGIMKDIMPPMLQTLAEYGIYFAQDERYIKHIEAVQILLFVHICLQQGYEHPLLEELDDIGESMHLVKKMLEAKNDQTQ